jgi:hypothetical protein
MRRTAAELGVQCTPQPPVLTLQPTRSGVASEPGLGLLVGSLANGRQEGGGIGERPGQAWVLLPVSGETMEVALTSLSCWDLSSGSTG